MKNKKRHNKNKGFSLIELLLVLGVVSISMVGIISYFGKQAEKTRAENAGLQFAEVGKALGNYITREATVLNSCLTVGAAPITIPLTVLTSATGTTTAGSCVLNNRQLLPSTFDANGLFNSGYRLFLRKNDSANINGLVLSERPIRDAGADTASSPRYDWLGTAMQSAGPQSGMTFQATGANSLRGLGGGWALSNAEYPGINQLGLFGYRVAYHGNNDDIYLRLDGAYPMRGNLNMGNYNINNATDINFNGWLNGNNALLNNLKTGYIHNSGSIVTNTLQSDVAITTGRAYDRNRPSNNTNPLAGVSGAAGYANAIWAPNPTPGVTNDQSYIHSWNIYSDGMIAVGSGGNINAFMNKDGLIAAKNIYLDNSGTTGALRGRDNISVSHYLTDRLPQYVSRGAQVVYNGTVVPKPACTAAGGYSRARIVLTPQIHNMYGSYDADIQFQAHADNSYTFIFRRTPYTWEQMHAYAVNDSTSWTIVLSSYGADIHSASNGWQALAEVFCDFG